MASPPALKSYAASFQDVLRQMEGSTAPGPDEVKAWARQALEDERAGGPDAHVAFAHGSLGLLAGHTSYMEGYAVLMSLPFGVAVALQASEGAAARLRHTNDDRRWTWDPNAAQTPDADLPTWVRVVRESLRRAGLTVPVEVVVASAMPPACIDARLSALSVATIRAYHSFASDAAQPDAAAVAQWVRSVVSTCTGVPYSSAYPLAVQAADPPGLTLVDTSKADHLPLPAPPAEEVRWGLITTSRAPVRSTAHHNDHHQRAIDALRALNRTPHGPLTSFSQMEHRDLDQALELLAPVHRPIARHLVGENRRVARLVRAVQTHDWQLLGTLLMMSHHSLRDEWGGTNDVVDYIVDAVADRATDGMFGACLTGRGRAVLLVGRSLALHRCLNEVTDDLHATFGLDAQSLVL
jgi:galactokinase